MDNEWVSSILEWVKTIEEALMIPCFFVDASGGEQVTCPRFSACGRCKLMLKQWSDPHRYGLNEAYRRGGKYVYYCPSGFTFIVGTIDNEDKTNSGGIALGPMVAGDVDVFLSRQDEDIKMQIQDLPNVSLERVKSLESLLVDMLAAKQKKPQHSGPVLYHVEDKQKKYSQSNRNYAYIFTVEKRLQSFIGQRDREGAQQLLYKYLNHVYHTHAGDLQMIKGSVKELVIILSRAAVAAGADVADIFGFTPLYLKDIDGFEDMEELSAWLSKLLHHFISASFDYEKIKHADVVHRTMDYIRENAHERLTLEQIANNVYLSKSYLSSIFKKELGISISTFINQVRVDRSKRLLRETKMPLVEIAALCCFEDQSYFSKVFKSFTGMTPKKYRDTQL